MRPGSLSRNALAQDYGASNSFPRKKIFGIASCDRGIDAGTTMCFCCDHEAISIVFEHRLITNEYNRRPSVNGPVIISERISISATSPVTYEAIPTLRILPKT